MDYRESVAAAAAALKIGEDANWELARLTYEVCGPLGYRGRDMSYVPIEQWADDVRGASGRKFSGTTAKYFREIWDRFGSHTGDTQISWTEAYAEIRGGTMGQRMVSADFKRAMTHATPEFKAEAFRQLAEDSEVIDAAMQSRDTRTSLASAWTRRENEVQARTENITDRDPISRQFREERTVLNLRAACARFADEISSLLPQLPALPDDDRVWLDIVVQRSSAAQRSLENYLSTGRTDIDAFLGEILGSARG